MGNIEAALRSVSRYMHSEETLLPLDVRSEARTYWSYILPALVRHPAMKRTSGGVRDFWEAGKNL